MTNGDVFPSVSLSALVQALIVLALLACAPATHAQIDYADMRSIDRLNLVGTAIQSDSVIDINGFEPKLAGAFWHTEKQHIARGFTTSFRFQITDTSGQDDAAGAKGGDGFAFVIQNADPSALGGAGGQLGYDPIRNSIAIEFDTYHNAEPGFSDPNGNHIAVHTTGTGNNSASNSYAIASNTNVPNLSDGRVHTVTITYLNGTLRVYLDGCQGLMIAMPLDIERRIVLDNGRAWVGFTAATGSAWERHMVHSWRFNTRPTVAATRVGLCAGNVARLTPHGRFHRYTWSNGATTPWIDVSSPGRYSVTVIDSLPCTPSEATFVYDVISSAAPRPQISQSDTLSLCNGARITLDAGTFTTWQWSSGQTTRSISVTTPGRYTVVVTDSLGCSGVDSVTIVARANPTPPRIAITGPTRFCSGDSVTLDAGDGYASYRWNNGARTQRIVVKDGGSYSVTVTNEFGCVAVSQPVVVTVLPRPYPVILPRSAARFCRGTSVTLDAGDGYASYLWSNGATTPSIVVDSTVELTVTVVAANGCVGTSAPFAVTVDEIPTPDIIASVASLCGRDTVTLRTRERYRSYRWSDGSTSETIVTTRGGDYSVVVLDSNGCEGTSATLHVSIDSMARPRITIEGPTELCEGSSVTLVAPTGLAAYRWSTGETTRAIVASRSGSYSVVLTDSAGCTASDSVHVLVHARPSVSVVDSLTLCAGESVRLLAEGAAQYRWSPSNGLDCDDCASPVATPLRSTRYQVIGSSAAGCADTAWTTVSVLPSPLMSVNVEGDVAVYPGELVELPVVVHGETAGVDEFVIELTYGTSVALLRAIVLGSDMLGGWQMQTLVDSAGMLRAHFRSMDGRTLRDGQTILTMRMQTFLGMPVRSDVTAVMTIEQFPCSRVLSVAGGVTIDSLCAMSDRLIQAFDPTLVLRSASPNPLSGSTRLQLVLGTASHASVEILSPAGTTVATIHDGYLSEGSHEFVWDATDHPSGLYIARLTAGTRRDTRALFVVR